MTHLTNRELSAQLDGALDARERERVAAHLAGCETCRVSLARLAAQDRSLASTLEHDPGEDYFESFAARVANRIRASGLAGAQAREERPESGWRWLKSPRALAWVGAAAAIVVGAGVVMMTGREVEMANLHRPEWTERETRQREPSAPGRADRGSATRAAPKPADGNLRSKAEASKDEEAQATADKLGEAQPGHAYEVKRNEVGEEMPVSPRRALAPPPQTAAPAPIGSGPVYAAKDRRAEPMGTRPNSEESKQIEGVTAPAALEAPPATVNQTRKASKSAATTPEPSTLSAIVVPKNTASAPANAIQKSIAPSDRARNLPAEQAREVPVDALAQRMDAREAGAATRRCGSVRDPSGRPVAGAEVIVAETGASVSTASDGSFCLEVPAAGRTLIAMAVGFGTELRGLTSGDREALSLTLRAVPVVGGELALKNGTVSSGSGSKLGETESFKYSSDAGTSDSSLHSTWGSGKGLYQVQGKDAQRAVARVDKFAALPESARVVVQIARILEGEADQANSASQYEAAATQWERALRQNVGGPLESEFRYRIAVARHRSWQIEPVHERMVAALSSTSAYLLIAPAGPEREAATRWLSQLHWGTHKAGYR